MTAARLEDVGVVVIGRNEGARLVACLESLRDSVRAVVYADSDSGDGSPERARALGAEVVVLDSSRPLNAARGRNAGAARLAALAPKLRYLFFVDGDCQVDATFLPAARAELERVPGLGAVCGRRRELDPGASRYNRAVDCEWNTPVGEAEAFGGDVLVRREAFLAAGGYDEAMKQGEDPEFAFRLRRAGWRIRRIECEMTRHDVALLRASAWRRRHERGGYAYAHGAWKHGRSGYQLRTCASILFYGLALPAGILAALWPTQGWALLLALAYLRLWRRIRAERMRRGDSRELAAEYATLITLGKFDEARGVVRCLFDCLLSRQARTLEYRDPVATPERRAA